MTSKEPECAEVCKILMKFIQVLREVGDEVFKAEFVKFVMTGKGKDNSDF